MHKELQSNGVLPVSIISEANRGGFIKDLRAVALIFIFNGCSSTIIIPNIPHGLQKLRQRYPAGAL